MTKKALAIVTTGWLGLIAASLLGLLVYSSMPGAPTTAASEWPADAKLRPFPGQHTIVLIAHPQCSCTRATLAELARLMSDLKGKAQAHVIVIRPEGFEPAWSRTDIWNRAQEITGREPFDDEAGVETARFGAHTSGAALLFSPDGELLFAGGLTPTRGHEGRSVGRRRVIELVNTGATDRAISDVFGCGLDESTPTWLRSLQRSFL